MIQMEPFHLSRAQLWHSEYGTAVETLESVGFKRIKYKSCRQFQLLRGTIPKEWQIRISFGARANSSSRGSTRHRSSQSQFELPTAWFLCPSGISRSKRLWCILKYSPGPRDRSKSTRSSLFLFLFLFRSTRTSTTAGSDLLSLRPTNIILESAKRFPRYLHNPRRIVHLFTSLVTNIHDPQRTNNKAGIYPSLGVSLSFARAAHKYISNFLLMILYL